MTARPFPSRRRGFTLVELLVAMAITTIIASVLVAITAVAVDAWNRSRSELRAARQAKFMVDAMAKDFESIVTRRGNNFEWLAARSQTNLGGSGSLQSSNSASLVFFTAVSDRYDGKINTPQDRGGDVSSVGYELAFKNPVSGTDDRYSTYTLYRLLVNPDEAFENLLGQQDLDQAFQGFRGRVAEVENYICENIYQYSVTFHVEVTKDAGTPSATKLTVPVSMGPTAGGGRVTDFRIRGTGIEMDGSPSLPGISVEQVKAGRVAAVEVSLTVISDFGLRQLQGARVSANAQDKIMSRNSFNYSKLIEIPGM